MTEEELRAVLALEGWGLRVYCTEQSCAGILTSWGGAEDALFYDHTREGVIEQAALWWVGRSTGVVNG